jgi:hypothetical protein
MMEDLLKKIFVMTDDRGVCKDDREQWASAVIGEVHRIVGNELKRIEAHTDPTLSFFSGSDHMVGFRPSSR